MIRHAKNFDGDYVNAGPLAEFEVLRRVARKDDWEHRFINPRIPFKMTAVISGSTMLGDVLGGDTVFHIDCEDGMRWIARGRPSAKTRVELQDWPGITDKAPVTLGHLKALGWEIPGRLLA